MPRFVVFCLSFALVLSPVFAQEPAELENVPQLRQMANQAHAAGDKEAFRAIVTRLHELRPNNSDYMYQLVLAHAVLGDREQAFNMMVNMQQQGLSYDFNESPESMNLRDTNLYEYLNDLMVKAGQPLGEYEVIAALDSALGRVEAIDWDPTREAFLVGSVTNGRLMAVSEGGSFRELMRADRENGLWGIHDIVVDAARNRLWVISASTRAYAGYDETEKGRSALFEFQLDSLDLVKSYPVPVDGLPHSLGSATLSANGDVFVADHSLPIIYLLKSGSDRLAPVFASNGLVALRGIAVSANGEVVYAADREMGVIRLDLRTGNATSLARAPTLNLGGIDGLMQVDGDLLIIQNGIRPQRIMRLVLDEAGSRVMDIAPVVVAPEGLERPTYGTIREDQLFFLASGSRAEGAAAPPVGRIAQTGIEGLRNIVPPDMERFLEQQARKRMAPPEITPAPGTPSQAEGDGDEPEG